MSIRQCIACQSPNVKEEESEFKEVKHMECLDCGTRWDRKTTNYSYDDVPTIARFSRSNKRHRVLVGPFGSGKSVGCLMEIIRRGHQQTPSPHDGIRRTRWAVVRNTYAQLKDTTMKTVFDWFPYPDYGNFRVADHIYEITGFPGVRIELFFRALDRPDQVANLLSLEITGVWLNEAREIIRPIWEAIDGRIWRYPKPLKDITWSGIIMDTNPPDEDNWLYKLIEKEKPDNVEKFKQPGGRAANAENRTNLHPKYYEDLAVGKSDEYIRSYIDGEYGFVSEGTPVFKTSWSDLVHCSPTILQPNRTLNLVTGWDFYLYPALVIGQLTNSGKLQILDELVGAGMGIDRFLRDYVVPLLNMKYRGMGVFGYGDPTGNVRVQTNESTCYKSLHDANLFYVKPCSTNALMPRINAVEHYLGKLTDNAEPAFQLSPNCTILRKGFNGGYRYKENGDIDKNAYSHPMDALEYLCCYLADKIRVVRNTSRLKTARKTYEPASMAGY
jgi:hypothetical protein